MSFKFKKKKVPYLFHASEISTALPECKVAKRLAHKPELAGEYTVCSEEKCELPRSSIK